MRNSSGPRDPIAELGERNDRPVALGDEEVAVRQLRGPLRLLRQRRRLVVRVEELGDERRLEDVSVRLAQLARATRAIASASAARASRTVTGVTPR